jgi:mono/diheme cytochrome c family protein
MKNFTNLIAFLIGTNLIADVKSGEQVYNINCTICHTIDGSSSAMGPDLNIVSYTRKISQIEQYVKNPASLYAEFGYGANAMPKMVLTKKEINDVAEYISSLQPFKKWMIKR